MQNISGKRLMLGVADLFLRQLKHRLWVLLACLRSDKTIPPLAVTLGWGGVSCLLVCNTTAEHIFVGQLTQILFTKRAERGNQAGK